MKRMEQLKFMVDLNWKMRFEKMEMIFSKPEFIIQFNNFLQTETGKEWLKSEEGLSYTKWQES